MLALLVCGAGLSRSKRNSGMTILPPNQGAAANRRPAGQSDGSGNLFATVQPTGRFRRRSLSLVVRRQCAFPVRTKPKEDVCAMLCPEFHVFCNLTLNALSGIARPTQAWLNPPFATGAHRAPVTPAAFRRAPGSPPRPSRGLLGSRVARTNADSPGRGVNHGSALAVPGRWWLCRPIPQRPSRVHPFCHHCATCSTRATHA